MNPDPYLNTEGDDPRPLYVVTSTQWGKSYSWLVPAASLKEAKAYHGWTRELYTSRSVRRARQSDSHLVVHES